MAPDRDDHGVLHHLGLDQAEHLGPEVLGSITPAQPAARHVPRTEMYTFDQRRADEDLEHRPRLGEERNRLRIQLHRDLFGELAGLPGRKALVRSVASISVSTARQMRSSSSDGISSSIAIARFRSSLDPAASILVVDERRRIEPRVEEVGEDPGEFGVTDDGLLDVLRLYEKPACCRYRDVGPQHRDLAAIEVCGDDQPIQTVGLDRALEQPGEGAADLVLLLLVTTAIEVGGVVDAHADVVQVHGPVGAVEHVRSLVDRMETEVIEQRHQVGDRRRQHRAEDPEPPLPGGRIDAATERGHQRLGRPGLDGEEPGDPDEVGRRLLGRRRGRGSRSGSRRGRS